MASEVPRLARQLFLRGLAAAFLAAFASLYVQLPGEPAAEEGKRRAWRGALCTCPGAPSPFPAAAPQAKAKSSQGRPGKEESRGRGGGAVSRLVTLQRARRRKSASRSGEGTGFSAWLPRGLLALRGRLWVPLHRPRVPAKGGLGQWLPPSPPPWLWEAGEKSGGARGQRLKGRHSLLKGVPCPHVPP